MLLALFLYLLGFMARWPRRLIVFPDSCVHKVWRGHNKEPNLAHPAWKEAYLNFLNKALEAEKSSHTTLHALTLMDNHAHEVFHVAEQVAFSDLMRKHHSRYGQYFNKLNKRSGKVAEGRPKTSVMENAYATMEVTFYVHSNPLRSTMDRGRAVNYRWSTHQLYACGKWEPWMKRVEFPMWYMNLGRTKRVRQSAYRRLFAQYLRIHGLQKQSKYSRPFLGALVWVERQHEILRTELKLCYGKHPPL